MERDVADFAVNKSVTTFDDPTRKKLSSTLSLNDASAVSLAATAAVVAPIAVGVAIGGIR
jgi:hypothetical protein